MENALIKVNYQDKEIGVGEKMALHLTPNLHRAFSVFIIHDGKMFIHRRNVNKYHSGGLWTNACCSHARYGVEELKCVKERLLEELGIDATPTYLTKFVYYHKFNENLYEYEYDHVYILDYDGSFDINPEEIEAVDWVDIEVLAKDIVDNPAKYSVWFITAFGYVYDHISKETSV